MIHSTTWKRGCEGKGIRASFINRGISPVKHSRQHNRAAVGGPGFSLRWIYNSRLRQTPPWPDRLPRGRTIVAVRVNLESISSRDDTDWRYGAVNSRSLLLSEPEFRSAEPSRASFSNRERDDGENVRKSDPECLRSYENTVDRALKSISMTHSCRSGCSHYIMTMVTYFK